MLTLKVTLRHVAPPVWRRLRVPGTLTLGALHEILQVTLGWTNSHMHLFAIGDEMYGVVDQGSGTDKDEDSVTLDMLVKKHKRFVYLYDMGDGWEHDVVIEKTDTNPGNLDCLEGNGVVPPEDCGGPPGYDNLRAALANPKHPSHEQMCEWIGADWKPAAFDLADVNRQLRTFAIERTPRLRLVGKAEEHDDDGELTIRDVMAMVDIAAQAIEHDGDEAMITIPAHVLETLAWNLVEAMAAAQVRKQKKPRAKRRKS